MRLLIIGTLGGQLTVASKIAMESGASVTFAETVDNGLKTLRSGKGADLIMIDVGLDITALIERLQHERIHVPVVRLWHPVGRAGRRRRHPGRREGIHPAAARSRSDRRGA